MNETSHPQQLPLSLRLLTACLLMPLVALSTVFFGSISLVVGLWDRSGKQQHLIARIWAKSLLFIAASPVTIDGAEKLGAHPAAVYVSNHLSYMDTPVLFAKLPFQFRILAKQSLWAIPFIGWYLNRSGQVPIDASSQRTAVAGLLRGVKTLQAGLSLVLFPEGGRTPNGHLHEMQSGSAFMAIKAGVPLVPITLVGTYELLPMHTYTLTPRPLRILVGDPIPTVGLTTRDADTLTRRVHDVISASYYAYSDLEHPASEPQQYGRESSLVPATPAESVPNPASVQPRPDKHQES
jgi:1-acyl-sn-glycerol-3-phosphate acyltransferase